MAVLLTKELKSQIKATAIKRFRNKEVNYTSKQRNNNKHRFIKDILERNGYTIADVKKNRKLPLRLNMDDLDFILEYMNGINRKPNYADLIKYVDDILNGEWDFDFAEGQTIVLSYETLEVLSAQHRIAAFWVLMSLGLIDKASWSVECHLVDPIFWVKKTQNKMTPVAKMRILARAGEETPPKEEENKQFMSLLGQFKLYSNGKSSSSGASDAANNADYFVDKYRTKLSEFGILFEEEGMPYRNGSCKLQAAMLMLYVQGCTDEFVLSLKDHRSTASTAIQYAIRDGFGRTGHSSIAYAIALLEHAHRIFMADTGDTPVDYTTVKNKPRRSARGTWLFSDHKV